MESLSQMIKNLPEQSKLKQYEQKLERLLNDPLVEKFLQKHPDLSRKDLKLHMNKIHQFVLEYEHCTNCPGLERCPNDYEGHYTKLAVDYGNYGPQIYDIKVPCRKFLAREKENAIRSRIRSFYVDEKALQQQYSIDEIVTIDLERATAVRDLNRYILKTKEEGLQKKGLYLAGPLGTGKTFLMSYMLHELAQAGFNGVIVYMPDFIEDLKNMISDAPRLQETIELLKNTELLVFDDIGSENLNPWARDHILGTILNYRMNRFPTFYTSNYRLNDLQQHLSFTNREGDEGFKGERLMERIRPFVDEIVVNGNNKRNELFQ